MTDGPFAPRLLTLRGGVTSAGWVFPVSGPPVRNGAVEAAGGRVVEVRAEGRPVDYPISALVPRTVNLHTHLELSDVDGPIGGGRPLDEWVLEVIRHRAGRAKRASRPVAAETAQSSVLLDIAQPGVATPHEVSTVIAAVEVLGLDRDVAAARLDAALSEQPAAISPHSPYSLHPDVTDAAVAAAVGRGLTVTMHLAESPAERRLLERGDGPLRTTLQRLGVWKDDLFGDRSIADELDRLSGSPRLIVAHGNDLRPDEFDRLARPNAAVAFCPRTHRFFDYGPHPVAKMIAAGVRVGLGTDSLASNPDLSVWNEMTFLIEDRPDITRETVLRIGTLAGAEALGVDDRFGSLRPGALADVLVVPLRKPDATDPYEALFG